MVPKAARAELAGFLADGTLKVRVQSPPERGKANAEVCGLLAGALGVPGRQVRITRGLTAALKQIRIEKT